MTATTENIRAVHASLGTFILAFLAMVLIYKLLF